MKSLCLLTVLVVAIAISACGASVVQSTCTPGQSVACIGPGQCAGGQACNAKGTGFEPCVCGVAPDDGGVDGGGVDGALDGSLDAPPDAPADSGTPAATQLLWLKADAIMGLGNGAKVSTWADSSSNARDARQVNVNFQPTYVTSAKNGLPAVHFTAAAGTYLDTVPFQLFTTSSSPLTIFAVIRSNDVSVQSIFFNQPQGNCSTPNFELGIRTGANTNANLGLHRGCYVADVTSTDLVQNTWYVTIVEVLSTGTSPTNVKMRWNGVDQPVVKDNGGWVSAGGYGVLSAHVVIGRRDDLASSGTYNGPFDGDVGEIVVYSTVDAMLRTNIETYLRTKWAI